VAADIYSLLRPVDPPAGPRPSAPETDRRGIARRRCRLTGTCRPVRYTHGAEGWPAETLDLSETGVGLLVCRRFEPGTLLGLTLRSRAGDEVCLPLLQVRSVLAVQHHWRLGCNWAKPLDHADLVELLGPFAAILPVRSKVTPVCPTEPEDVARSA
jgi:hypothetical protein